MFNTLLWEIIKIRKAEDPCMVFISYFIFFLRSVIPFVGFLFYKIKLIPKKLHFKDLSGVLHMANSSLLFYCTLALSQTWLQEFPAFAALQSKLSFKGRAALYKQRAACASWIGAFPAHSSNRNTDLKALLIWILPPRNPHLHLWSLFFFFFTSV